MSSPNVVFLSLHRAAYDDGRTQLLLCLHGLLPIAYRGASYHIPIAVWITREYPRLPPIAYVVPTSDMLVRASKFMDVSGKCQIEYLQNWERKSEVSTALACLIASEHTKPALRFVSDGLG